MRIDGEDPLDIHCDDVTYEGANTSLQIHLRVNPSKFAAVYNAVQLATAPALAVSVNSPTFLGHRLWEETRVALFKQAVDDRPPNHGPRRGVPRVVLRSRLAEARRARAVRGERRAARAALAGHEQRGPGRRHARGWHSAARRAAASPGHGVALEPSGLRSGGRRPSAHRDARAALGADRRRHDGERGVPRGPRARAVAKPRAARLRPLRGCRVATSTAPRNTASPPSCSGRRAKGCSRSARASSCTSSCPSPSAGSCTQKSTPASASGWLAIIERRATTGQTGAQWQRSRLAALEDKLGRKEALARMLGEYLDHSELGAPVHTWPIP